MTGQTIQTQGSLTGFFLFVLLSTVSHSLYQWMEVARSHVNRSISMTTEHTPSDNEKCDMVGTAEKRLVSGP